MKQRLAVMANEVVYTPHIDNNCRFGPSMSKLSCGGAMICDPTLHFLTAGFVVWFLALVCCRSFMPWLPALSLSALSSISSISNCAKEPKYFLTPRPGQPFMESCLQ